MVWPITGGKSYVGHASKSMKAGEFSSRHFFVHQLFAGTPSQALAMPASRGIGINLPLVGPGCEGCGLNGNGKLIHKPSDAQPSSSVRGTSCGTLGYQSFLHLPATDLDCR